jgi:Cu/Zn superoxide dismutase
MGNLDCDATGSCLLCFAGDTRDSGCAATKTLLQEKMSLSNGLRSVVGRSVAIHLREDKVTTVTEHGLGDAGPAIAYGTVGIVAPGAALPGSTATSSSTADTNLASPPSVPAPEKTVCIFRTNVGTALNKDMAGKAIIAIDLAKKLTGAADYCNMRVEMTGLLTGVRSFHFHQHGDLRYGMTTDSTLKTMLIGPIHNSDKLTVKEWNVQSTTPSIFETSCTLGDVSELIGRSLTVHEGADASTPTIAMAVCGLANPSSCFEGATSPSLKCGSSQSQNNNNNNGAGISGVGDAPGPSGVTSMGRRTSLPSASAATAVSAVVVAAVAMLMQQ